jgi:hypothetical protein
MAAGIALVLDGLLTMMSWPWQAFLPVESNAPDVHPLRAAKTTSVHASGPQYYQAAQFTHET